MLRATTLLLLLAGPAAAQGLPSPCVAADTARMAAPVARCTAADTVQAIHGLFAKHRRIGGILTVGAIGADLALAGISAASENTGRSSGGSGYGNLSSGPLISFGFGGYAVIYGLVAAPIMGVGIQQLIAFGPEHEAKVIAEYKAHHQLPAKISRRLGRYLRHE